MGSYSEPSREGLCVLFGEEGGSGYRGGGCFCAFNSKLKVYRASLCFDLIASMMSFNSITKWHLLNYLLIFGFLIFRQHFIANCFTFSLKAFKMCCYKNVGCTIYLFELGYGYPNCTRFTCAKQNLFDPTCSTDQQSRINDFS